jgi:hypothetical protein
MNRIFNNVWNEITRTYVAVAETVKRQGKSAGASCVDGTQAAAQSVKLVKRGLQRPRPMPLVLEARLMFDGAAVDSALHAANDAQPWVADAAVVERLDVPAAVAAKATVLLPAVEAVPATQRTEIIFVEINIADLPTLLAGLTPGAEVFVLDAAQDGLKQITQLLAGRSGVDAIHIVSHGSDGSVGLGTTALDSASLQARATELAQIGQSLTATGDILLYGCNVSAGDTGAQFVGKLAQVTGADVAASSDLTGAAALGGDWVLEAQSGAIDSRAIAAADYKATLIDYTTVTFSTVGAQENGF